MYSARSRNRRPPEGAVQFIHARISLPLVGQDPTREYAEDGRQRFSNNDDQPGFGKALEQQAQSLIAGIVSVPDFLKSPALRMAGGVGEERLEKVAIAFPEFRFAAEIVPSGPVTRIAKPLDPLQGAHLQPVRKSRVQRVVIGRCNVPQEPVMFAPYEKIRVGVQDGLEQRGTAASRTGKHYGTINGTTQWMTFPY